jgi:hypothetical protein
MTTMSEDDRRWIADTVRTGIQAAVNQEIGRVMDVLVAIRGDQRDNRESIRELSLDMHEMKGRFMALEAENARLKHSLNLLREEHEACAHCSKRAA